MKTTDKISSFIGGLAIAFAMTLFIPSTASATWGNYSSNSSSSSKGDSSSSGKSSSSKGDSSSSGKSSNSSSSNGDSSSSGDSKKCAKYKTLAYKYLKTYYKCYNYKYYKKYIYYIKKYKQCKANVTVDCDKYKSLADKYLAAYYRCGYYCYYKYYCYYLNLYKKCEANLNKTGKVYGLVFEDTNGDGVQDAGEPAYAGAEVNITDETGVSVTATTGTDGKYSKEGIAEGSTTIVVIPSSLPTGASITTEDPTTINVIAGQNNDAGADGFEIPVLPGSTCGVVLIDSNNDGAYDTDDTGIEGVSVTITDAKGEKYSRITDANGLWCVDELSAGNAETKVDVSTLPDGATQVYGMDPSSVYIIPGQYRTSSADGYVLPPARACPRGFDLFEEEIYTSGRNTSDNLQTILNITFPSDAQSIEFRDVHTRDKNGDIQPYEQFKIVAVDSQGTAMQETIYTTDIDNTTKEDEFSNLGTLPLDDSNIANLVLVHRADPTYGDNIPDGNSVTFKSLCYSVKLP